MKPILSAALALAAMSAPTQDPTEPEPTEPDPRAAPEAVVRELYDLVTFDAGSTPDWDAVRRLFLPEAIVVLRTGRERMSVFSLEGFIADFVKFIEEAEVEKTGFTERVLGMRTFVYGDIAQVLVVFDSHIPGSARAPRRGLDSFELIRREDGWRIVSITNERPTRDNPIPKELFD